MCVNYVKKKQCVRVVALSEFLFTKMLCTNVKISCRLLCFTQKCIIELLIHKMHGTNVKNSCSLRFTQKRIVELLILVHKNVCKLCEKKLFLRVVALPEFLFTKMHCTNVKISCSLLCCTQKCIVEILIHKNVCKVCEKKIVFKSCNLIRIFIYQDALYKCENQLQSSLFYLEMYRRNFNT